LWVWGLAVEERGGRTIGGGSRISGWEEAWATWEGKGINFYIRLGEKDDTGEVVKKGSVGSKKKTGGLSQRLFPRKTQTEIMSVKQTAGGGNPIMGKENDRVGEKKQFKKERKHIAHWEDEKTQDQVLNNGGDALTSTKDQQLLTEHNWATGKGGGESEKY